MNNVKHSDSCKLHSNPDMMCDRCRRELENLLKPKQQKPSECKCKHPHLEHGVCNFKSPSEEGLNLGLSSGVNTWN